MLIVPDFVYDFKFKSSLSTLDGIYKVLGILSYTEVVSLGLDLFKITYEPNSITVEVFDNELDQIRAGKIAKLIAIDNPENIQYIPEYMFDKVPDGTVQRYLKLGLAINLGIFDDAEQLSVIRSEVEQVIAAMLGVNNSTIIYTTDKVWMTSNEYTDIQTAREAAITRISNHYVDKLALQKENDSLRTKLAYYEDALKALTS